MSTPTSTIMFLGHFALGFAAKKASPAVSLGTAFLAAQWIDLLWPFFLIAGWETVKIEPGNTSFTPLNFISYPYTHSLLAVLVWAVLVGGVYYLVMKNRKAALVLAALVISHWLLDFATHRPDLPLSFSETDKVGLGLWNHKWLTLSFELFLFFGGVWIYSRQTVAKNRTGVFTLWGLVVFFLAVYMMNVFGDPPPDEGAIGYVGLAQWLFIFWAYWIDNNRVSNALQGRWKRERYSGKAGKDQRKREQK